MKKIALSLISFYQAILSTALKNLLGVRSFCRFNSTCSEYAKLSISKHGLVKGGYKAALRLLRCQPWL